MYQNFTKLLNLMQNTHSNLSFEITLQVFIVNSAVLPYVMWYEDVHLSVETISINIIKLINEKKESDISSCSNKIHIFNNLILVCTDKVSWKQMVVQMKTQGWYCYNQCTIVKKNKDYKKRNYRERKNERFVKDYGNRNNIWYFRNLVTIFSEQCNKFQMRRWFSSCQTWDV